jgi:hypothetical protein
MMIKFIIYTPFNIKIVNHNFNNNFIFQNLKIQNLKLKINNSNEY